MIIRSQDKKNLCTLTHVSIVKKDKTNKPIEETSIEYGIVNWIGNNYIRIGIYSTEEKAVKVLDMIQKEYGRHYYGEGGPLATINHYVQPFAFIPPKVFQMPSDEEIEVKGDK